MPAIRGYIAATLDGFIASPDGGIEWLEEFGGEDYGYDQFFAQIGTVVMGRRTYDQVRAMGQWPYASARAVIVSRRSVDDAPPGSEVWSGPVGPLVQRLRQSAKKDVWVVGGAEVQQQFIDADGLDRIEIYVIPLLLGAGVPLWPGSTMRRRVQLVSASPIAGGMLRLEYTIGAKK